MKYIGKGPESFQLLVGLFHDRFFRNDTVSVGGFQTNVYQLLGFLTAAGLFVAYFLAPPFVEISLRRAPSGEDWALESLRLFFPAYSFAVVGFATAFEWDTLFPDRRDFLILGSLPIRTSEILVAKFVALIQFLLLLIAAVTVFPNAMVIALSFLLPGLRATGFRLSVAQIAATAGVSAFAFFSVASVQGFLMIVSSVRIFRRISPWVQMIVMSLMTLSLITFPIYSALLQRSVETNQRWLWLFPPIWFSGFYELFVEGPDGRFATFGWFALQVSACVVALFSVTWMLASRRHLREALQVEELYRQSQAPSRPRLWIRSSCELAIYNFIGATLARGQKHQLFLATYISVGLAFATLFALAVRDGKLLVSPDGVRSSSFLIQFFAISGLRAAFQFPAELASNWPFRMNEDHWMETARSATRKRVLVSGLIPVLAILIPGELIAWGWKITLVHAGVQLLAGTVLVELLFWNFDKIPFTFSYVSGATNLSLLAAFYLYGFTSYSFHMADIERLIEGNLRLALFYFTIVPPLILMLWRRRTLPTQVHYDAAQPVIQTLDLT